MRIGAARTAARDWIDRHADGRDWFRGAYITGSTVGRPDDAELAPSSDVDVLVVTSADEAPPKPGKVHHGGALVEITYLSWQDICSADHVLESYHLAAGLRTNTILSDPTGELGDLQAEVARH